MGNGFGKITNCLSDVSSPHRRRRRRHHDLAVVVSDPCCYDEGLGHSFCYVRPEPSRLSSSKVHHHEGDAAGGADLKPFPSTITTTITSTTTFKSISGASVSANTSTAPLSSSSTVSSYLLLSDLSAAAFDCSDSFSSVPLQPIPRFMSGPLSGSIERGFLSGPIERGFLSGPIDARAGIFSGPIDRASSAELNRSFSNGGGGGGFSSFLRPRTRKGRLIRGLQRVIARTITRGHNAIVAPVKKELYAAENGGTRSTTTNLSVGEQSLDGGDDGLDQSQGIQWAQGKAGEDRVHVVISEEQGWVFVGIYDGFNGPDAPDYLLSNLYPAVQREVKGLLWEDKYGSQTPSPSLSPEESNPIDRAPVSTAAADEPSKRRRSEKRLRWAVKKWEENQRRWKCEWEGEKLDLDRKLKEQLAGSATPGAVDHADVLKTLSLALEKTEDMYLEAADSMVSENPELALMGSCVLVMLMKGEDVYLMNVGDSRAVLAQKPADNDRPDLEGINKESSCDPELLEGMPTLAAHQLTLDHSTSVEEEVQRIRKEHPDDPLAVTNDRVKGSLKVTRAFGAGYLKQPKWNNALLEMFRVDYVGPSPYLNCHPSLLHHRLSPKDRFLILSSDGLYQYFTNEEAIAEVELFISLYPEGDPAQHLVEEVLFRAAKKAGMDFHDLLEIPQGDRRRYHDDVSIIIISLEGRIWRSCV